MAEAFGRELLQVVEIDIDFCALTYGTAPCTAALGTTGERKCFNSRFTCQDPENYDRGSLTLRFAQNQTGLPKGTIVFPALKSVSTRASDLNIGGIDNRRGPLGSRAEVTIQIEDFAYADWEIDKYASERVSGAAQTDEGGYDPQSRGTFWGKFRRRHPYVVGRPLRVREGYVGQAFGDMRTRHYVVTSIDGPDGRGGVTIRAKDILDLADNNKAVAPKPSQGLLDEDIDEDAMEFELRGAGSDYASSGRVRIGGEVIRYTRSGTTFTVVERGADGTEAESHSADDTVQQCLRFEGAPIYEVARDLLRDFAGVDTSFIPYSDWQSEGDRWQAGYRVTRTISQPTGITTMLAELSVLGVSFWWDEIAQQIKYRVNRPLDIGESYIPVTDQMTPDNSDAVHHLDKQARIKYAEDQRVSTVFLWHGLKDPTDTVSDGRNFRRLTSFSDPTQAGVNKYGQEVVREFFCPWLGEAGNNAIARPVTARLLKRFVETPRVFSFEIDAKDAENVELGSLVEVFSRVMTDDTGREIGFPMQVTTVEESVGGHLLKMEAKTYVFDDRYGFITENSRPNYVDSTDAEREQGTYFVDGNTLEFPDGTGPYVFF